MSPWLDQLNPAQQQAVTEGDGPVLVIAGAGTGKTKTLACRVAWLIEQGVPPDRILLLTFTRRAAAEMLNRAGRLVDGAVAGRVWGGTFHAVANRLLRYFGRAIDLAEGFTIIDQGDAADLMNLVRADLGVACGDKRFPRKETLLSIYSRTVNAREKLSETLRNFYPWCEHAREGVQQVFGEYMRRKREQNVMDYDDLLLHWHAMAAPESVGDHIGSRFEHVLVDEYQDTNALQSEILQGMRRTMKNIMVVGDDAQSIYSFRAATVRNILDFPKQFPGARLVRLEQNYRSTEPILAASNAVMSQATERFTKTLWSIRKSQQRPLLVNCVDEAQQCEAVCGRILEHREAGIDLRRQAVLFRAGHHSAQLEIELARRKIPFHKYGGLRFIEAAHIKDVLAFLRILENPYDQISWFRLLQMLEGVGPRRANTIVAGLLSAPDAAERESPLVRLVRHPPTMPAAAREQFEGLRRLLAHCSGLSLKGNSSVVVPAASDDDSDPEVIIVRTILTGAVPTAKSASTGESEGPLAVRDPTPPGEAVLHDDWMELSNIPAEAIPLASQIECIRRYYEPIFETRYDNARVRVRDLEQLEQIASTYRSRSRFITDLTLDPPTSTSDLAGAPYLDDDYLILSTIHSAKGCEWDAVHILHAADGMIPSDMSTGDPEGIDEERRLLYVAMTRAKDWLYLYFPLRYYHTKHRLGDAHSYAQLSRFLSADVLAHIERHGADDSARRPAIPVRLALDRALERIWQD